MSTRGLIGFVIDGEVKATYNHSDSYPDYLGQRMLIFAASLSVRMRQVREQAAALKVVTDDDPIPNPLGWALAELVDVTVGGTIGGTPAALPAHPYFQEWSGELSWYQVLRGAQGDLDKYLRAGYMEDGSGFADSSLFCEWGWLIDLDHERLEVYRGFVEEPHTDGRFGTGDSKPADWTPDYAGDRFWYPIRLVKEYDLRQLPTVDEFLGFFAELERAENEKENA